MASVSRITTFFSVVICLALVGALTWLFFRPVLPEGNPFKAITPTKTKGENGENGGKVELPPEDPAPKHPLRADSRLWEQYRGQPVAKIVRTIRAVRPETGAPSPVLAQSLKPLKPSPGTPHFPWFENRQSASGLDFTTIGAAAGDCAVADFNGDHFPDVVFVSPGAGGQVRIFANQTDGTFADVSSDFFGDLHPGGSRVLVNDFDNDGDSDLFLIRGEQLPNSLLENVDGKAFVDATENAGLLDFFNTTTASWIDFDQDGWLDLSVFNDPKSEEAPRWRLFRNSGDGTFSDLAWEMSLTLENPALQSNWPDVDQDGYPEALLSFDSSGPKLFRSVPADTPEAWRFEDITATAGLDAFPEGPAVLTWDFDNDGALDLTGGSPMKIFQGTADGKFKDITEALEIPEVTDIRTLATADLDGNLADELMVGTGDGTPNRVFWNRNSDRFRDVSEASGLGLSRATPGLFPADLDLDGDSDVLALVHATTGGVFDNPGQYDHRWLRLSLEGKSANRAAIGARVSLVVRDIDWILHPIERVVTEPGPLEIGLGNASKIESMIVTWPVRDWPTAEFTDIPLDRWIQVSEGETDFEPVGIGPEK